MIIEFAGSGHADAIGVFFLVLFFYFLARGKVFTSAFALIAATLTKFVPILLLPFALFRWRSRKAVVFLGWAAVIIFALFWPFHEAGTKIFDGLRIFAQKWQFNASLFQLVFVTIKKALPESRIVAQVVANHMSPDAQTLASTRIDIALWLAKEFWAAIFVLIYSVLLIYFARRKKQDPLQIIKIWLLLFGTMSMITSTLHPWYLAWLIPALVFFPIRAWLLLSATITLSYFSLHEYFLTGIWQERLIVKLFVFVPFYVTLLWELIGWRGRRNAISTAELHAHGNLAGGRMKQPAGAQIDQ